jgi:hypothetical protein
LLGMVDKSYVGLELDTNEMTDGQEGSWEQHWCNSGDGQGWQDQRVGFFETGHEKIIISRRPLAIYKLCESNRIQASLFRDFCWWLGVNIPLLSIFILLCTALQAIIAFAVH